MKLKTINMRYILFFLLPISLNAQKIIQAGSFATGSALADTAQAIRADFPKDTSITATDEVYSLEDSFLVSSFRFITVSLVATPSNTCRVSFPAASEDYEGCTFYIQATNEGTTQAIFFNADLNGTGTTLSIDDAETVIIRVAQFNGGWMWIAVKSSAFTTQNGIISALPDGDVDIPGAVSSDLRIQNTRIQFDARMKIGADSSFIHDPVADTTVIKGDIVMGKFTTNNTYPFSMRNKASSSTTLLLESGATTGYAGIKLTSYNLPSQIEFGGTTSKYLNFYNANNTRNVMSVGTNTNARTVLVGNTDPGVNGGLIVNDTISSGKGLVYFRKTSSNSTPLLTLTSVSNDRFVFHDDGRLFLNNLGTGTATQTLGLTSSGQVIPYTQVYPTAHVSAIDANIDVSTQVNSSINTYVSYYLSTSGNRYLTFPAPSSTLAGRGVIVSYNASGFGGYNLNMTATGGSEFWYPDPTTGVPGAYTADGYNVSKFTTFYYVCRQINGTYYWVRDNYTDMFIGQTWSGSVTGITGGTVTFSDGVLDEAYNATKLQVYKNGVRLFDGDGYTVSDNNPVTLTVSVASISGDKWNFIHIY